MTMKETFKVFRAGVHVKIYDFLKSKDIECKINSDKEGWFSLYFIKVDSNYSYELRLILTECVNAFEIEIIDLNKRVRRLHLGFNINQFNIKDFQTIIFDIVKNFVNRVMGRC